MKNNFISFFRKTPKLVLVIAMRPDSVKAVLVELSKFPRMTACESTPSSEDFAEAGAMLSRLKSEAGPRLKETVLMLGREELLLKSRSVASGHFRDIRQACEDWLLHEIPYERSEVVLDYLYSDKEKSGESKILFVVGHRRVVDEKLKRLAEVPLVPDRVDFSSHGAAAACKLTSPQSFTSYPVLILDVDEESCEAILVQEGGFIQVKKIDLDKDRLQELDPATLSVLFGESKDFLQGIFGKSGVLPQRILLTGVLGDASFLKEKLSEFFGVRPSFCNVEGQEGIPFSLTSFYGAASLSGSQALNLLPVETKHEEDNKQKENQRRRIFSSLAFLMASLLLFSLVRWASANLQWSLLHSKIEEARTRDSRLVRTARLMEYEQRHRLKKWEALKMLAEVHRLMPPEIALKQVEYQSEKGMTLRGLAKTNQEISGLLKEASASPVLGRGVLSYSRQKKVEGQDLFDFQIIFPRGEAAE